MERVESSVCCAVEMVSAEKLLPIRKCVILAGDCVRPSCDTGMSSKTKRNRIDCRDAKDIANLRSHDASDVKQRIETYPCSQYSKRSSWRLVHPLKQG